MTQAMRGRFMKVENGAISDHLRNHVHLTNCIHMKNHLHRQSPITTEGSFLRDLAVLQRSRSLRDPSMSPHSWHSPSNAYALSKKLEEGDILQHGRRSLDIDLRETRRVSGNSLALGSWATSKVRDRELIKDSDARANFSDRDSADGKVDAKETRNETKIGMNKISICEGKTSKDDQEPMPCNDLVAAYMPWCEKRIPQEEVPRQDVSMNTLSQQMVEHPSDDEQGESSQFQLHSRHARKGKAREAQEGSIDQKYYNGMKSLKRRKGIRRAQVPGCSREAGHHIELSVASNSLAQVSGQHNYRENGEDENMALVIAHASRNGCGIPWNWTRIHHRSKIFLDRAGRSLSCGLSESRLRNAEDDGPPTHGDLDMPASDQLSSSGRYDSEALPLLLEPSGSHQSGQNTICDQHGFSGELGIFANNIRRPHQDSGISSEARPNGRRKSPERHHLGHRCLTQKYMPRTFKDLVGQNLAVQALSNAVIKRKIGFLYVFYGPHGTGKTSCARIFSRSLNCQSLNLPKPCGACTSCIAFDMGKSRTVREVGGLSSFDFENIMDSLKNMVTSNLLSHYRVFIVDDCDTMPSSSWSAILKVIELAPRKVVFIFVSASLDHLPHIIISRCQKFFFPKLKDADIIYTLQWIAVKEDFVIDKDALKLIASRSDGSLRDAEMTLDQLSLLGKKVSLPLVQELVGLIPDDVLIDLLDLALSGDTVNTVKSLREIMETGVEPLVLMSQLATVITDILAGSYVFTRERLRKRFFRRLTLTKEDMEKLRQALKTLSDAEKQLRMSNDRLTWLTAALLQLAPDKQYAVPISSGDASLNHSSISHPDNSGRESSKKSINAQVEMVKKHKDSLSVSTDCLHGERMDESVKGCKYMSCTGTEHANVTTPQASTGRTRGSNKQSPHFAHMDPHEIWFDILKHIRTHSLRQLMLQEGKLTSVYYDPDPTLQLAFSSHVKKTRAEKFRGQIMKAVKSVLGSPVTVDIICESMQCTRMEDNGPLVLAKESALHSTGSVVKFVPENNQTTFSQDRVVRGASTSQSEIVEMGPQEHNCIEHFTDIPLSEEKSRKHLRGEEVCSHRWSGSDSFQERKQQGGSILSSKVSLAHAIKQARAESLTQRSGWSTHRAMSIAEKLEEENLRLEPGSRSLLCWEVSKTRCTKLPHLRIRTRSCSLQKLVPCSRCLALKTPKEYPPLSLQSNN